ncbi:MAG TPA: carboxypeptidase regulatory-like domain-containing protein [Thermoanaerobaculia bacterium]|nr:carboxypeptidase regulatory-like domain-containing protein [Thermoanaerobaculia bacterium]
MPRLPLLLCTLALALPSPGLSAPVSPPASLPVTGWVGDPHGKPLAGARVTLALLRSELERQRLALPGQTPPEPVLAATSDAAGSFTLAAPEAGMWTVRIEAAGAVPVEMDLVPLIEAQELPPFHTALAADGGVEIRVLDPAGHPLAGANVAMEGAAGSFLGAADPWRPAPRRGQTGADGKVRLPRKRDERLKVRVNAPGYPVAETESSQGRIEVRLAPGTPLSVEVRGADGRPAAGMLVAAGPGLPAAALTDESGRATVFAKLPAKGKIGKPGKPLAWTADGRRGRAGERPPGAELSAPLLITLPKPAEPRAGQVVDRLDRRPLPGALVWPQRNPAAFVRADARGGYALPGAAEGKTWSASAAAAGHLPEDLAAPPPGRGERALRAPTFALEPAAAVQGSVVDAVGRPLAGATLSAAPAASRFQFQLPFRPPIRTRSGKDGSFALRSLGSGVPYEVTASLPGFAPTRLTLAEQKPLAVRSGVRIVLQRGRIVRGRVVDGDGQGIAAAMVQLVSSSATGMDPFGAAAENLRQTTADAGGRFAVEGLAPGRIDVAVQAPGFAPALLRQVAVPAALEAGNAAFDLRPIVLGSGVALTGTVVDGQGRPVAGAAVQAEARKPALDRGGTRPERGEATTGTDGRFTVSGLSRGRAFLLTVEREGFASRTLPEVKPPLPEPLRIVLSPAARLAGEVVDDAGAPVAGARVRARGELPPSIGSGSLPPSFFGTTTDDDGHFELRDTAAGKVTLTAAAAGFLPATLPLQVVTGQSQDDLRVVLHRGSTVAGRVLGPDGTPAAGAAVSLLARGGGLFAGPSGSRARTDGDGGYLLDAVPEGAQSFSAELAGAATAVRELAVRPGENRLDFQLADGLEIAGRVVDPTGAPVSGAQVTASAGDPFPNETASGDDGSFRFGGLRGGAYRLAAQLQGFASTSQEVRLADASVRDVELRLGSGGAVAGRIVGLPPEQLAEVTVSAYQTGMDSGSFRSSPVDAEGQYRIGELPPGEWSMNAMVGLGGRSAHGKAQLPPGVPEVRLDLEFPAGFTLSGRLLRGGQPVPGNFVAVRGTDVETGGAVRSDGEGAFRVEGLKAGTYKLTVNSRSAGQVHEETLELTADREVQIDLPAAEIRGRVVDADEGSPLAEANVSLEPADPAKSGSRFSGSSTGPDGAFALDSPVEGDYRVIARKDGYAPADALVHVGASGATEEVKLSLSPAAGLRFTVRDATGSAPGSVGVALLDPAGRVLLAGNYPVSEGGRVRLTEAPAGHWLLLVAAGNSATATRAVDVPGSRVTVDLPDRTRLTVLVPTLAGKPGAAATLKITGADGLPYRSLRFGFLQPEWRLAEGRAEIDDLPPGVWQLRVEAPGGKVFSGSAATAPGVPAMVSLK